jgi:hypothetical protein
MQTRPCPRRKGLQLVQTWLREQRRSTHQAVQRARAIGKHFSIFYEAEAIAAGWPEEELRRAQKDGRFEDEGWRLRKDGSRLWANGGMDTRIIATTGYRLERDRDASAQAGFDAHLVKPVDHGEVLRLIA